MSQQIIIEGDLVRLVNITDERTVPLADWLPLIERRVAVHTPVLPRATRAIVFDPTNVRDNKLSILMEMEPQIISLNKRGVIHRIMIPWTRFVFHCRNTSPQNDTAWQMSDYRIFWSKNKYTNPTAQDMIRALVPNVYSDGRICFGSTGANANQSLADRLDQTVNEFYSSEFNADLGIPFPNDWTRYSQWVRATNTDPLGWMNWPELQDGNYNYDRFSWDTLINGWTDGSISRNDPVMVTDPVPPLALGATFGRITQWLSELTPDQRSRIRLATDQLPEDAFGNIIDDEDEDEEDEEE